MNILINYLYKEASGPVFSLEMARGFAQNGCNVYAVLSNKIANRADWEAEKNLKGVCFIDTGTRKTAIQATVKFFLYKHKEIKQYFKGIEFDYIVQTFYHPWAEFVNKQINYIKILTLCHDPVLHSGVKKTEVIMTQRFIKNSDDVVVLTKSFIPLVKQNYGIALKNIHYMPHGRMDDYKKNQTITSTKRYDESRFNFLFFGRISEYKGLHVLAKAYTKLEEKFSNVTLTVAGSGDFSDYEEEFKELKTATVENRYIQDDEVGNFFDSKSVILVLPYLDATQSGVAPIALEYGVPIIASNSGGLLEQLNDGQFGLYSVPGDADSLYEKMKEIVEHPELIDFEREKMADFLSSLEWSVVVKQLLESLST